MSPFALLFLSIQQRLATIVGGDSLPIFKTIDQDLGQLEDASRGLNRPPVNWPCALIDIDDTEFSNISENDQLGRVHICIRIGFPPFSSTELNTPATYKNKALYYYDLEQQVYLTLQGWNPTTVIVDDIADPVITADLSDIFGHFMRQRVTKEDRNDLLRIRQLTFSLTMDDNSAELQIINLPATLTISDTFNLPE